ncbi:hypothetical protein HOLleu_40686 [Holothuria leucospilota]|uniref:Uncharacterized protein n=1 Tax=Holothuria leucospilota TaxID=206669 RepID=A0A9Q0YGE3_HOLLE|nr:hypothetical protein HOLleu_40686 [Holothuria leucospilota]
MPIILYSIEVYFQYPKNLPQKICESLIHAFILSRLDRSNRHMYGLPDTQIFKLQRIQNPAARVLTGTKRPVFKVLHWLPVSTAFLIKLPLLLTNALKVKLCLTCVIEFIAMCQVEILGHSLIGS